VPPSAARTAEFLPIHGRFSGSYRRVFSVEWSVSDRRTADYRLAPLFRSLLVVAAFACALAALGALLRRGEKEGRRRLRRSVVLFSFYVVTLALGAAIGPVAGPEWTNGLSLASRFFEVLIVIDLAALAVYDVLFPSVRIDLPDIIHDLTLGVAYLVAIGWLMRKAGVDLSSIVATSAVVTAVLGLSLQATLGNVVGGVALQLDDSISEGDWIELESKVQGEVKKIRWRHTVIETRDWDTLIVPNSQLLSQTIKVLGKRRGEPLKRRMWVYFNVDFRFRPSEVIRVVEDALHGSPIPRVAAEPKAQCVCYDFARDGRDSFAYYALRYWLTDLAVDDATNSMVRERIYHALRRAQIPLAVPASTLFFSRDDEEHAAQKRARQQASFNHALDDVELFSKMSAEERAQLAERVTFAPFGAGEVITKQGSAGHWLYILVKGEAEVRFEGAGTEVRTVAHLRAPSFFGEMALMTGSPREATVIAEGPVECLRLDKEGFREVLSERAEIAHEVSTILAQRRVELIAVQEHLDADAKKRKMVAEKGKILAGIQRFFGLEES
jgi:small-conductance mechanosensitive channel/CRP-like cAMP-binding protein